MLSPRTYIAIVVAMSVLLSSPVGLAALFLKRSGELDSPTQVATWLLKSGGLYGTALNSNAREVALELYLQRRPDVAVLSSSRGTEFRQEYFSRNFSCACMIMSNIAEGFQFLEAVRLTHLPKVVILALDYWWFSQTDDHTTLTDFTRAAAPRLSWTNILSLFDWIREGKLTAWDFVAISLGSGNRSPLSNEPKSGIQALKKSFGTRPDGSWSVLSVAANIDLHPAIVRINRMLRDPNLVLSETSGRYQPDQKFDPDKMRLLDGLVRKFRYAGTGVVLMLLPIAPPIVQKMTESGRYEFIAALRSQLAEFGARSRVEFYDFYDPAVVNGTICEFQDPHHGGNALYARMLALVLRSNPQSVLREFVDRDSVERIGERYSGRVVAPLRSEAPAFQEVDFLGMGCRK